MRNLINIICLIFAIMFYFLYNMMTNDVYFAAGTLFATPGIIGLFKNNSKEIKTFTIVVFLSSLLNILATSYGIGGSIVFLVVCGITYSCLKYLKVFFTITLIICLWLIVFLYYQMLVIGTVNGDLFLQYGLSKNYPGSMLVIFNCLWVAWKHLYYHKLPLLLPILSTIMAFFLDGRSSLICMVLITILCFIFRGKKLTLIMATVFAILIFNFWDLIVDYYELSSLASKGMDSERSVIWKAYFNNLDFTSLIFGLDTQDLPVLREYSGNPHNSFLSYHRRMGLLAFCALLYYIIKEFRVLIKNKMFVLLTCNAILLLRMFFDGMLVTAEDFFILTLFFMPLCFKNEVFCIEKQIDTHGNSWIEKMWDKFVFLI